jgi:hypothetical protein
MADIDNPRPRNPYADVTASQGALRSFENAGSAIAQTIGNIPGAIQQGKIAERQDLAHQQEQEALAYLRQNPALVNQMGKSTLKAVNTEFRELLESGQIDPSSREADQIRREISALTNDVSRSSGRPSISQEETDNLVNNYRGRANTIHGYFDTILSGQGTPIGATPSQAIGAARDINPLQDPKAVDTSLAVRGARNLQKEQGLESAQRVAEERSQAGLVTAQAGAQRAETADFKARAAEEAKKFERDQKREQNALNLKHKSAQIDQMKVGHDDKTQALADRKMKQANETQKEMDRQDKILDSYEEQQKEFAQFSEGEMSRELFEGEIRPNEQQLKELFAKSYHARTGKFPVSEGDKNNALSTYSNLSNIRESYINEAIEIVQTRGTQTPGRVIATHGFSVLPQSGQGGQGLAAQQTTVDTPTTRESVTDVESGTVPAQQGKTPIQSIDNYNPQGYNDQVKQLKMNANAAMRVVENQLGNNALNDKLYKALSIIRDRDDVETIRRTISFLQRANPDVYNKLVRLNAVAPTDSVPQNP